MRQLTRYVSRTVVASIFMVLAVILGVDVIASILDELQEIRGSYTFLSVLQYVVLTIPSSIYENLPFAALVGCLAGLGSLASSSELVVMRAAGVSTSRIVWMVLRPTLVITLAGLLISEYIAPHTENIAQSQRAIAMRSEQPAISKHGLWHREGHQFMHFNVVEANGVLHGVMIYQFDDARRLTKTIFARRAIYQRQGWLLEDITESEVGQDQVEKKSVSARPWQTALSPELLNILVLEPSDLPIEALWSYSNYLQSQGLNDGFYRLALWKKVLLPVSTLSLVLVAISFIFGPLRQVTMGYRIFIGVVVGIVFRTAQEILAPASMVYGFAPVYASLVPILLCTALGGWMLIRVR